MREILFRGKRIDNGEWVEGYFVYDESEQMMEGAVAHICHLNKHPCGWSLLDFEVDPETVGQYTGLADKSGKRIFGGDVVEYNDGYDCFKGEVVLEAGAFGMWTRETIGLKNSRCDNYVRLCDLFCAKEATDEPELYYCTVIGNIHDNPKLLEV